MFDFPNSPTANQIVTGPNGAAWQWDGTKWRANSVWQNATVVASDTPPTNPPTGALWWDSVGGQLYVNFQDPNSVEWVIANSGGIPDAPLDGNTYARSNQQWVALNMAALAAALNNTGRNLVHNGLFNVAQRGAGPWTTNGFTLDRWSVYANLDTVSYTQQVLADADRAAIGDEAAMYALRNVFTGNAGSGAQNIVSQSVENVRRLSGKTITVSFWAQASAALRLGLCINQNFGNGGSPSPNVYSATQLVTLATAWARYSLTFALPSVAGKTFGTNAGTDITQPIFVFSSGASTPYSNVGVQSGTVSLWGVQLEVGTQATPLARRDPADDLALCQRFYQIGNILLNAYNAAGANPGYFSAFPVTMRAVPTFTQNYTTQANCTGGIGAATQNGLQVMSTVVALGNSSSVGTYTASADL